MNNVTGMVFAGVRLRLDNNKAINNSRVGIRLSREPIGGIPGQFPVDGVARSMRFNTIVGNRTMGLHITDSAAPQNFNSNNIYGNGSVAPQLQGEEGPIQTSANCGLVNISGRTIDGRNKPGARLRQRVD